MSAAALRRLLAPLCLVLVLAGLVSAPAQAKTSKVPRVTGVTLAAQDWYDSRLRIRWHGVAKATYQLRWAYRSTMRGASRPVGTRAAATTIGPLNRGTTWYFQARAVRRGKVGRWSAPKRVRFKNPWPGAVSVPSSSSPAPGRLDFSWKYVPYASRYRLLWSAKPYGGYREAPVDHTATGWVSQYVRHSTLRVPTAYSSDATQQHLQTALPYGNPVYVRLQANNAYATGGTGTHNSHWSGGVFPRIPTPAAGTPVRVGTYNLDQNTSDVAEMADNIRSHGLSVVALQEARNDDTSHVNMATKLANSLGWAHSTVPNQQQQLIYDTSKLSASSQGTLAVTNFKNRGTTLQMPYVRLTPKAGGSPFWFVSVHFVVNPGSNQLTQNSQTAADAKQLIDKLGSLTGGERVIVAGDFTSNREPYVDANTAAQPVFVQHGYWDTRASLVRRGVQYSTVNRSGRQTVSRVGVSTRADYIMTKGIHGSTLYENVANRPSPPSDHNLVYSEVRVP